MDFLEFPTKNVTRQKDLSNTTISQLERDSSGLELLVICDFPTVQVNTRFELKQFGFKIHSLGFQIL